MEDIIENDNSLNEDNGTDTVDTTEDNSEEMVPLSRLKEIEATNRQLFERAKKAEGFVKVDGKWVKAPKAEDAVRTQEKLEATSGELSETQLDYLDLKGITADEDIAVIQGIMKRTGMTVRQALGDEYVKTKLEANKQAREVSSAIPSASRRSGSGSTNDVDYWASRVESGSAQLSDIPDFTTRAKVVEARERKSGNNAPPWRR
jgi:hypothetical protein